MKKKYYFININVIKDSPAFLENTKLFLDMLGEDWKIISAVGAATGVQYILEKEEV